MAKRILCGDCGKERRMIPGKRTAYDGTDFEPAEFERVMIGKAKQPKADQRVITVETTEKRKRFPLELEFYNCDSCGKEIFPGTICVAQTIWIDTQAEPKHWEEEFMEVTDSGERR